VPGVDLTKIQDRARAYLSKIEPAVSGQRGHDRTFRVACALVLGFGLAVEEALPLLTEWNERCQPPWTEKELLHKLEDADKKDDERGYLLGGDGDDGGGDGGAGDGEGGPGDTPVEADDDPHRLAQLFLQQCHTHPLGLTLRHWRGEWLCWQGGAYRAYGEDDVQAALSRHVRAEFTRIAGIRTQAKKSGRRPLIQKVTRGLCGDVAAALQSLCLVGSDVEQPTWLGEAPFPAAEVVAARNGLLHVPSFLGVQGRLHPITPAFFSGVALDFDIDLAAPRPAAWLAFLGQLWPNDPQSVETLQDWFGYCLVPDTALQKIFFLLGPTRSGKGTICRVLERLLGTANVVGPTFSGLAGEFGLQPLLGKPLAVVSDARLSARTDRGVVVERLLAISGEDTLTVNRKHQSPVTGKLPTRLMIATNELPNLLDASGALVARLVVLRLTQSFLGQEDTGLLGRLVPELPGILLWSLEGLRRLRVRGRFVQPPSGRAPLDQMSEVSSPVKAFVEECCEVGPGLKVAKRVLYAAWLAWCGERGHFAGNDASFGRNLGAAFPGVETSRESGPGRRWLYTGLDLKPEAGFGGWPGVARP
jgi:putative DNA primase/helicase